MKKNSVALVLDTNLAQAAGAGAVHAGEPAPQCVAVFNTIYKNQALRVALNAKLNDEWKLHQREFARKWLINMFSRKRVDIFDENTPWEHEPAFLDDLDHASPKAKAEILKDMHLLKLAMLTDKRVISLDKQQLDWLSKNEPLLQYLRGLHWASPTHAHILAWLEQSAPADARFEVRL